MKTTIITLLAAAALCVQAADDNAFSGNEISVEAFGAVVSPDLDSERTGYGFGLQYYLTRNLGVGAFTTLDNLNGHTFENVTVRGLWRVPIGKHAFYAHGGATRYFRDDTRWNLVIGPGYEWRPIKHVGVFSEIGLEKELTGEQRDLSATARAGVRLTF